MFRKRSFFVVLVSVFLFFVVVPASLAVEKFDEGNVTIGANEVIEDDVMVFANDFVMDGTIKGDLVVFATTAKINGVVEGDILGTGQEIILNGTVEDDARVAGMVITLGEAAHVADDMLVGAYSLESKAGSVVAGDLFFGGAQALLAGDVNGDLSVAGGGLELLGTVGGDVQAEVGSASDAPVFSPFAFMPNMPAVPTMEWGLTVGDQAQIGGDLNYSGPVAATIPTNAVSGEVSFEQVIPTTTQQEVVTPTPTQNALNWLYTFLRQLVALLIVGAIMVWMAPHWTSKVAYYIQEKPLPTFGWGLLTVALILLAIGLTIAVMVMLAMTFGALTLSSVAGGIVMLGLFVTFGLVLLFAFTVTYFSKVIVGLFLGRYLFNRFNSRLADSKQWSMALGVLLIVLLTAIPYVGWLIGLAVTLLGFGALWMEGRKGWQDRLSWHTEEPVPEAKAQPA